MGKWEVSSNGNGKFAVWRQTRELSPGEPMHSGVREIMDCYDTREEAEMAANTYNEKQDFVETTLANTLSEALGEPVIMNYVWQNYEEIVEIRTINQDAESYPWRQVNVTANSLTAIVRDVFEKL